MNHSHAQGVIIDDGDIIKRLFRNSAEFEIVAFADSVSPRYSRLILHPGKTYPFQRGGLFFHSTSKANLLAPLIDNEEGNRVRDQDTAS